MPACLQHELQTPEKRVIVIDDYDAHTFIPLNHISRKPHIP